MGTCFRMQKIKYLIMKYGRHFDLFERGRKHLFFFSYSRISLFTFLFLAYYMMLSLQSKVVYLQLM